MLQCVGAKGALPRIDEHFPTCGLFPGWGGIFLFTWKQIKACNKANTSKCGQCLKNYAYYYVELLVITAVTLSPGQIGLSYRYHSNIV